MTTIIHVQGDGKNIDIPCGKTTFQQRASELGFLNLEEKKGKVEKITAAHSDKGTTQRIESNEIFVLLEEPGYGSYLYKAATTQEEGETLAKKVLESEWVPVGTQVFVAQDLVVYRKAFSDQVTIATEGK